MGYISPSVLQNPENVQILCLPATDHASRLKISVWLFFILQVHFANSNQAAMCYIGTCNDYRRGW